MTENPDWTDLKLNGLTWQVRNDTVENPAAGGSGTMPAVLFRKIPDPNRNVMHEFRPRGIAENYVTYALAPVVDSQDKESKDTVIQATIFAIDGKKPGEPIRISILPDQLRCELATRFTEQLATEGLHPSRGLLGQLAAGANRLHDTTAQPSAIQEPVDVLASPKIDTAEVDVELALAKIIRGVEAPPPSQEVFDAQRTEYLVSGGMPPDYHEQIDRLLDEGGPEAAARYAAQFEQPKGHAGKEEARRYKDSSEERGR